MLEQPFRSRRIELELMSKTNRTKYRTEPRIAHQLEFIRRDSDRLFKHGERMIATTSNLISGSALN